MKGLIVKPGDDICKMIIFESGGYLMANVTRCDDAFWSVSVLSDLQSDGCEYQGF